MLKEKLIKFTLQRDLITVRGGAPSLQPRPGTQPVEVKMIAPPLP